MRVFRNSVIDEQFRQEGFVKFGNIDSSTVKALSDLYFQLNIPDFFGCGYNCGMNSDQHILRKRMQEGISALVLPYTEALLEHFNHYTATYVNKAPKDDCFVVAHQDFSYSEEPEVPSFMCFIPLVDVSIENAALGFIPKSHLFYNTVRAFPFPCGKTAVTENDIKLMSYFEIIEMKAGDMVFFNQNTIHGSFSNYSDTDRLALSISFSKKDRPILSYIHNPMTNGKTVLKYEVDNYAIVNYNNPVLNKMYDDGNIQLPFRLIEEFDYAQQDTSWENIKNKLDKFEITSNPKLEKLINQYHKLRTPKVSALSKAIKACQKLIRI